jgi:glutathione S-transferase
MRLRFSRTSPYARKVRVTAFEKGLSDQIELIETDTWNLPDALLRENPLGKIPALVTAGGDVLFDSPVICEYLDTIGTGPSLLPAKGDARWRVLRLQALADGMMDAAVERYVEAHRPLEQRCADWDRRQQAALSRCLDYLERSNELDGSLSLGTIAVACALDYLDLRFTTEPWRLKRPRLASTHAQFAQRASLRASVATIGE